MAVAVPTGIPVVAQPAAGRLERVLRWTYVREDETIRCRLALTPDCSAYELKLQPPGSPARASGELFDDALSAFERQSAIERSLVKAGFVLAQFESALEPRL